MLRGEPGNRPEVRAPPRARRFFFPFPGLIFGLMANTAKRIKVRFNLSRGKNWMKWKVEYPDGEVEYFDPETNYLSLMGCTLKNSRRTAQKIFQGEHKTVCAWILCESIRVKRFPSFPRDESRRLRYNPKVAPYWTEGEKNVDGEDYLFVHTIGKEVYAF